MPDNPTHPITGAEQRGPRGAVAPDAPEARSFAAKGQPPAEQMSSGGQEGSDPAGAQALERSDHAAEYGERRHETDDYAQLGLGNGPQGGADGPATGRNTAGAEAADRLPPDAVAEAAGGERRNPEDDDYAGIAADDEGATAMAERMQRQSDGSE